MYFGINNPVLLQQKVDLQDIGARLFLSPRVSVDHASRLLKELASGRLTIDKFNQITDSNISEIQVFNGLKDNIVPLMKTKLEEWIKTFGEPTKEDYEYIESKYYISYRDMFGEDFNMKIRSAKEMASIVKEYIIGQDLAINRISVSFFQHMESIRNGYVSEIKSPILLVGPTGVGKSEIYRQFGRLCNCPVIRINSSEIVPSGWKGLHISDILARSVNEKCTIEDLSHAILVFHEFDKITHHGHKKVSDSPTDIDIDLMRDIMCLFESGYKLHLENGYDSEMKIRSYELPTDNLMIVFDGAFYGMEDIVRNRLNIGRRIGFDCSYGNADTCNILNMLSSEDFITWGYTPELMGRIGEYVVLNPLTTDIIYQIMTRAKNNIISAHVKFCKNYHVDLRFTDEALYLIAEEAHKSGFGFRNVRAMLSKCLNDIYFELCDNSKSEGDMQILKIDKEYIANQLKIIQL